MAFLAQLGALLTQVSSIVSSPSHSTASKSKMNNLGNETDAWLKDFGRAAGPRPSLQTQRSTSIASPADITPLPPVIEDGVVENEEEEADGEAVVTSKSPIETHGGAASPATELSSFVAGAGSFSLRTSSDSMCEFSGSRTLVDLVTYLRLLFDNDIPERPRLQSLAKSMVRLLMVRCCSSIMASLQRVVYYTYPTEAVASSSRHGELDAGGPSKKRSLPSLASGPEVVASGDSSSPVRREGATSPSSSSSPSVSVAGSCGSIDAIFVTLARDIRIAASALLACMQLVISHAVPTDATSAKFPVQLSVDVLKQARQSLGAFQARVEEEELKLLRRTFLQHRAAAPAATSDVDGDEVPSEWLAVYLQSRVGAVRQLWGAALVRSVARIGEVVEPAMQWLTSVAGIRTDAATAALLALKKDTANDITSLCSAGVNGLGRSSSAAEVDSAVGGSYGTGKDADAVNAAAASSPTDSACQVAFKCAATEVLLCLGCSFTADRLAAVSRCSGDSTEGHLVSTRLLTDLLQHMAAEEVETLRCILRTGRWARRLYDGILNCIVSIQPSVVMAGLSALHIITKHCPEQLGQEIGFIYSNTVMRLVGSPNSPLYVKQAILSHLISTFLSNPPVMGPGAAPGQPAVPLLMHMYRAYDLNIHAHQLNFVQQLTGMLSCIVRAAPKEKFISDTVVQEQLKPHQDATATWSSPSTVASGIVKDGESLLSPPREDGQSTSPDGRAAKPTESNSSDNGGVRLASQSLPSMALYGLVRIVELLAAQAPPEDDTGKDWLALLPTLTLREKKLSEQRQVDLFNNSPQKAIRRLFNVTAAEETVPPEYAVFSSQWDHAHLPPPATAETAKKIEAVVDFLSGLSSLHPEAVSEYLTTPGVFPLQVCAAYLRRLPFAGSSLLEAIEELLMVLPLPKEGQRIERLLEYVASAYFSANSVPGIDRDVFPFENDTACFIVMVATVMLNTNIHNPSSSVRLDQKSFRSQLRGCNGDSSFSNTFVDAIFYRIAAKPLESIKTVASSFSTSDAHPASANVAMNGMNGSTNGSSRGAFDLLFVSQEERKQIAFGVERQRILGETHQLLQLRSRFAVPEAVQSEWWCAAAKDLFLSTWSSVCAVFGPAMYEGSAAPKEVVLQCIRGLQCLLCIAAAFNLSTECEATLLTLLRMSESSFARPLCRKAILVVAASSYAIHLPIRCWVSVCQMMMELHDDAAAATHPLVEDVYMRIENLTRLSMEEEARRGTAEKGTNSTCDHVEATAAVPTQTADAVGHDMDSADVKAGATSPTMAIHRILHGIIATVVDCEEGNARHLEVALELLRRSLEFSRIMHRCKGTEVVYYVNIRDFCLIVMPAFVTITQRSSGNDEALQLLFKCLVDLLCTMWLSYSTRRLALRPSAVEGDGSESPVVPRVVVIDTAPGDFVQCFTCLRRIYDATLSSAVSSSSSAETLLQMHVLQAVKEVLSRTLRTTETTAYGQQTLSLYTMVMAWQQILYPLAMALCDRSTTATETGSLALLVLRKLVGLCGGTGASSSERLPPNVRGIILFLLAHVTYIGGMCSDVDTAMVCVGLLSSICTTTLSMDASSLPSSSSTASPMTPGSPGPSRDEASYQALLSRRDRLASSIVSAVEGQWHYVAQQTLARLCLLLRCEREQTRAEVVSQLRTLSLQMQPAQVQPLALELCEVILEGTIGNAAHHHKTPITHSSLASFVVMEMPVPQTMRRCSRSSFRATLPAVLNFFGNDLMAVVTGPELVCTATAVLQRCLLPIIVSPNCPYQARFVAMRSMSQCIAVCFSPGSNAYTPAMAQVVLNCLSMALYILRLPLARVAPPETTFVGRRWIDSPQVDGGASPSKEWASYRCSADRAVALIEVAEPHWIVYDAEEENCEGGSLMVETENELMTAAAAPLSRSLQSGSGGNLADITRSESAAVKVLSDSQLIEYINLVAQALAGVPKELGALLTATESDALPLPVQVKGWTLPTTSPTILLQLLLEAAGTIFAVLWRINHPMELQQYILQYQEFGGEGPVAVRNGGLLPHAAIRNILQAYVELALLTSNHEGNEMLLVATDIVEAVRQVQGATQPIPSAATVSSGGGESLSRNTRAYSTEATLTADGLTLQRLAPQEQQHIRTCNSGMYQQLVAVLAYLMKAITTPARLTPPSRVAVMEAVALHPQFFAALVSLLTPSAGNLILTVRDYFAWYIAHQPPHLSDDQMLSCNGIGYPTITTVATSSVDPTGKSSTIDVTSQRSSHPLEDVAAPLNHQPLSLKMPLSTSNELSHHSFTPLKMTANGTSPPLAGEIRPPRSHTSAAGTMT